MKTIIKSTRRMAAIVFSLALLCGVVAGTNLFVSANETEVTKYSVDFSELSALVAQDGGAFTNGVYAVEEDDANINTWVDTRFTVLTKRADGRWHSCDRLGTQPEDWTTKWQIAENAGLGHTGFPGDYLEKVVALTLGKDGEDLKLKNFEASVVFNTDTYKAGAVFLSFHEQVPGRFGHDASVAADNLQSDAVLVAANGDIEAYTGREKYQAVFARSSGEAIDDAWAVDYPTSVRVSSTLVPNTDYKLYVKVVNGVVYYTLTSVDGATTYYSGSDIVGNTAGAISVGIAGRNRILKSIEVTELDNKGKAVDLGTFATKLNTPVEVDEYAVDFRDLATVATNAGKDVSAGYKATAEDTAINEWVNARFGGLHSWDNGTSHQMNCIGDSTQDKYWLITENGLKGSDKDYCWHATYGIALTLKQDNEYLQLKNFEASLVFNTDGNNAGNVFISFHEPAAGNVGTSPSQVFTPVGDIALSVATINCAGIVGAYYDCQGIEVGAAGVPLASNGSWGSNIAAADRFYKDGAETTLGQYNDYKLNVKVVNGTATITVTDMNGTVYGSKTTAVSDKAGTISIGTAARSRVLKSIKVTELDEDGIPVDLGTYANPVEDPITVNQFKVDFADLAAKVDDAAYTDSLYTPAETDTELDAWVLEKFGMTYNREGHTFANRAHLGTVIDTAYGHGNTYWLIDKNGYLQKNGTINGGEMYRDMELLTVKGSDGEYAVLDNFEARIVFKNTTNGRGVVGVFFNEQTPGKMAFYPAHADYLKQDAVLVGVVSDTAPNGGITVKGSGDNLQNYIYDMKEDFAASAPMTSGAAAVDHEMIVKVIGSDVYVKVTTPSTGAVLWEKTYAGAVKGVTGTVSIGVGKSSRAIKSVTITQLDEAGLPVDFQVQKDNTVKVSGKTLTVKAGEGYELKAGSLIVTDAKGATILPQRVGYREGGNADKYTIPAEAVAPYTVDYEFIKPGDESGYNVGFLGTSVHADNSALRFVYRLNIDKDGKVLYNEEKVTVKEYGLLLASAAILPNAADLDIETAEDSMHVHQFKWPASNRYYDKCDDYVDIAVQINGIPESAADMDLHTRAYIVLENDDVVYMNPKTENYEDASSTYVTEKVVDLLASNRLRTIGRQEVTAEKLVMEYNNAAVVISGELKDSVVMRMANTSSANSIVHVIVDGNVSDEKTIVLSGNSVQDVVLCGGLQKGNHTIEVIRGTCTDWSTLDLYSVTYNGTLTAPMTRDLQIEFLGDSITCAMGAIESNGTYNYGSSWQDGFHSYAAITARNLNADASMLSVSGMTTQQVYEKFDDVKRHVNDGAWNFAANPQDIVVINLGTNDHIHGVADADVATTCANLLRDVRNTYGKDTYIVWAYGMMYDGNIENYKKAVRNFNDERTLFCDLSPAKNTAGWGGHPNEAGQAAAAAILTAFLRDNCLA